MSNESAVDLSDVLLPVTGQLLVVPNAMVAEIIKRRELVRPATAPDWLLGHVKCSPLPGGGVHGREG